ncbi:MAG: hypothetical protein ACKOC0_06930 [Cytophagales bacterium]
MSVVIKKKSAKQNRTKRFNEALHSKGVDTRKYCGVIKLQKDPLAIQKELRNEWE